MKHRFFWKSIFITAAVLSSFLGTVPANGYQAADTPPVTGQKVSPESRVHFLLQIDVSTLLKEHTDDLFIRVRTQLNEKNIAYNSMTRENQTIRITFAGTQDAAQALEVIRQDDIQASTDAQNKKQLRINLNPETARAMQQQAVEHNMAVLHQRLQTQGIENPVIQQQGLDHITVELSGTADIAQYTKLLTQTGTLEMRIVDDSPAAQLALRNQGPVPAGTSLFTDAQGSAYILEDEVLLTQHHIQDSQPDINVLNRPAVLLTLNAQGKNIFSDLTLKNRGKRIAIVWFKQEHGEVLIAPTINEPIPGGKIQISGAMTTKEVEDMALLLRSGPLAAPMKIIEQDTANSK